MSATNTSEYVYLFVYLGAKITQNFETHLYNDVSELSLARAMQYLSSRNQDEVQMLVT